MDFGSIAQLYISGKKVDKLYLNGQQIFGLCIFDFHAYNVEESGLSEFGIEEGDKCFELRFLVNVTPALITYSGYQWPTFYVTQYNTASQFVATNQGYCNSVNENHGIQLVKDNGYIAYASLVRGESALQGTLDILSFQEFMNYSFDHAIASDIPSISPNGKIFLNDGISTFAGVKR